MDASGYSSLTRDVREAALALLQLLVRRCVQPRQQQQRLQHEVSEARKATVLPTQTPTRAFATRPVPDRRRLRDLWAALFTFSPTAAAAAALPLGALGLRQPPRDPLQASCLAMPALSFVLKLGSHTV